MDGGRPIIPGPVTPLPSSGPRPPAMERRVQCARPNRLPHIRTPLPNPVQPNLGDQEADAWRSAVAPGWTWIAGEPLRRWGAQVGVAPGHSSVRARGTVWQGLALPGTSWHVLARPGTAWHGGSEWSEPND